MIKRILVGLGGSSYTASAVKHAIELAQLHDAQLTGVTIVDVDRLSQVGSVPLGGGAAAADLREHRLAEGRARVEEAVSQFTSACAAAGMPHTVRCEEGDPFALLTSLARYHDLTVFGLRSLFEYGVLGEPHHDATELLIPLIASGVRPIVAVGPEYRQIRRVMVAYSGSMESAKTLRRFLELHPWNDVTLRIVTFDHGKKDAERLLDDAAEFCRAHGFDPELEHVDKPPLGNLLPAAEVWKADLIVMGNSGRTTLLRRIFGETALDVMRNSTLPLFLSQ